MRFALRRLVAASAAFSAVLPGVSLAQEATKLEKVEVTGSSIKRIDAETALPVQVLRREDIERVGASTTEELLKQVTATTSAGSIQVAQANGTITTSQSTISLRALGSTRTLVLVNGRRVAVFGGTNSTAVDVNSIPIAAIERIEVLKETASSLYGSDAIAGVVNFILRRDFTGAEVSAMYGEPTMSGGGKTRRASAFIGFGKPEDRWNVSFGAGWEKQDPILGSSRNYAHNIDVAEGNDLSSTIAFPGNILYSSTFGRLASPAFPNCGPTGIVSPFFNGNVTSGQACRFENSPFLTVQSGVETKHAILNGRLRLTSAVEGYFEGGYTQNKIAYATQPVPISEATALPTTNPYNAFLANLINTQYPNLAAGLRRFSTAGDTLVLLPTTSPYFPTAFVSSLGLPINQPIAFRYRDFANGLRNTSDNSDNYRLLVGVRGTVADWDYDSAFVYSESKASSNLISGYPRYSLFLPILDSGIINPFGATTDPAAIAAAQSAEFRGAVYRSKTSTTSIDGRLTRELMPMRGGSLAIAAGAELREEVFTFDPSQAFQIGDIAGFGGNILGVDRKRHVASAYGELAAPILKSLEVDFGVRFDSYQTVGNTTNPKLSMRWNPLNQLLVRGSLGTGFRAPSLTDLYTAQASSVTANGTRDPLRCPNPATGAPADCNNQFPTITGGNPNLKPEKSRSATLGMVLEPTKDLSLGFDAYWIFLKDSIVGGGLSAAFILANAQNATQYSSFLVRGAPDGNASGLGPIVGIVQTTSNLFKVAVSGTDVDLKWSPIHTQRGRLTARLDGSYVWHFKRQNADNTYTNNIDQALNAAGGIIPRWRHVASLTGESGPWSASVSENYQKRYHDLNANITPVARYVGAYETFDAQVAFAGVRNLRLSLGVKNWENRIPPYTNLGGQFAAGYDVAYADVRGRFVYGMASYTFR